MIGIGINIWTASNTSALTVPGAQTALPPGQAYLFARGSAAVSFVSQIGTTASDLEAVAPMSDDHERGQQ